MQADRIRKSAGGPAHSGTLAAWLRALEMSRDTEMCERLRRYCAARTTQAHRPYLGYFERSYLRPTLCACDGIWGGAAAHALP